eukprot:snap_masked-scaffold_33-processed-gene-2.23-mRNA-1 protein AED:1.00 eAED:1.00 QI:0/0/0/0/1/1/2/0/82
MIVVEKGNLTVLDGRVAGIPGVAKRNAPAASYIAELSTLLSIQDMFSPKKMRKLSSWQILRTAPISAYTLSNEGPFNELMHY